MNLQEIKKGILQGVGIVSVFAITGMVYANLATVTSGETITSTGWNEIVDKLNDVDTNNTDLVTKAYVDALVLASGGSGGYFTKCQVKFSSTATYPACPAGFSSIHTYADSGITSRFNTSSDRSGINYFNTTDSTWSYYNGSYRQATRSCTVCKED